jgi:hypothetical protein
MTSPSWLKEPLPNMIFGTILKFLYIFYFARRMKKKGENAAACQAARPSVLPSRNKISGKTQG